MAAAAAGAAAEGAEGISAGTASAISAGVSGGKGLLGFIGNLAGTAMSNKASWDQQKLRTQTVTDLQTSQQDFQRELISRAEASLQSAGLPSYLLYTGGPPNAFSFTRSVPGGYSAVTRLRGQSSYMSGSHRL